MIEIRTSNGGRGIGAITNCNGTHLLFRPRGAVRVMWVPIELVVLIQPVST